MKKSNLKENFIYNIIYQILILVLPLITAPYLSRVIGGKGIGIYSYTQAFANYFVLIALLGVENYGNREIARIRDNEILRDKTFWEIYSIQFLLTIILSIAYVGYLVSFKPIYYLIYLLQFFYVISSGFNINWFFFGMEKFKLTVIRNAIIKTLTTISIFIFVKKANDLWLYTLIISVGFLLSNLVLWPFLVREVKFYKPKWEKIKKHIKPDLFLFLPVVAISLYNIMDKLMLGSMSTYTEVGYYTYAEKIVQVPVAVIIALGTVMMPRVSNLMKNGNYDECKRLFNKAMTFVLFMSFAFMFGMINLAPLFSNWYYGSSFSRCGFFMSCLAPVIVFKSWANLVRTQYIIPKGYDNIYIWSVFGGAIFNLVANFLLIPRFHGLGAIIGTILAEFVVCFIQTWGTRKEINFIPYLKDSIVFMFIGISMFFGMNCIKHLIFNFSQFIELILLFIFGATIYIILSSIYLFKIKKYKIPLLFKKNQS